MTLEHGAIPANKDAIHIPYEWTYTNAAARTGDSGFVSGDVGKLALQTDDNTLWILTDTAPTWKAVGSVGFALAAVVPITANTTLTAAHAGKALWVTNNPTLTLPAASSMRDGESISIVANAGCTINRAGADLIYFTSAGTKTSLTLQAGQDLVLVNMGGVSWLAMLGSGKLSVPGVEIGMTMPWSNPVLPEGWQWQDGMPISRTTFADLFSKFGTVYGAGDGSTTFNKKLVVGELPSTVTDQLPSGIWTLVSGNKYSNGNWIVDADSYASGYQPYKAVDNSTSTYWIPESSATSGQLIVGNTVSAVQLAGIGMIGDNSDYSRSPGSVTIDGSNDYASWTRLVTSLPTLVNSYPTKFIFALCGIYSYKYYRFTIYSKGGSLVVGEFEIYPYAVNQIIKVA